MPIIGIAQARAHNNKEESMKALEELLSKASADLIVTPEYLMLDPTGLDKPTLLQAAEPLNGWWVERLSRIAVEHGSCIIANMFERDGGNVYNTTVIINRDGGILSSYRKTHLFDALGYRESSIFTPGSEPPRVVEACGIKVGAVVCFEIRFPELFRRLALEGAELITVPAAWYRGDGKEEAIRFLAQARAHENTVYLAVAALYGGNFTGRSMLVDPMGIVTLDLGHGERYMEAIIDKSRLEEARRLLPLLGLRRPELY